MAVVRSVRTMPEEGSTPVAISIARQRELRVDVGEIVVARDGEIVRDRTRNAGAVRRIGVRRRAGIL